MLPDWEAFVAYSPEEYITIMKPALAKLLVKAKQPSVVFGEAAVDVNSTFNSLRKMIQAMNYQSKSHTK